MSKPRYRLVVKPQYSYSQFNVERAVPRLLFFTSWQWMDSFKTEEEAIALINRALEADRKYPRYFPEAAS